MIWDPFHPATYLLHTVIGTLGVVGALVALAALKGSRAHVRAGWVFVVAASVAATTAVAFSFTLFAPLAIASALITFSLLGSAVLALRRPTRSVIWGERVTAFVMGFVALAMAAAIVLTLGAGAPVQAMAVEILYVVFPIGFFVADVRHVRARALGRVNRDVARHLSRMGFALAIAIHAPIVSFGDRLGLDPMLAFFGPFIVWPLILYGFRRHRARRAPREV